MSQTTRFSILPFSIVLAYLSVALLRHIGTIKVIGNEVAIIILFGLGLLALFGLNTGSVTKRAKATLLMLGILFLLTLKISIFPGLSVIFCFFLLSTGVFFASMDFAPSALTEQQTHSKTNLYNVKLAIFCIAIIHALVQISFYIASPERTTGLLDDFSQAAFFLLLAYGLIYPSIKNKPYVSGLALLVFVAFFTTFSRSANFLLFLFFIGLFIYDLKNKNLTGFTKQLLVLLLALSIVYIYPSLVAETTVDRGGISHFSTLNSRTIYWNSAWEAIKQNPIWGYGMGTYTFTGIKLSQPFNIIHFVHNDYLQVWHDLGIIYLLSMIALVLYLLIKYTPFKLLFKTNETGRHTLKLMIDTSNEHRFIAWWLFLCVALYMVINFLIYNLEFQIIIAVLVLDLIWERK